MGKDGAYASGSYKTGIKGLKNMQGASNAKVIAAMKDSTHGYAGKMSDQDFTDLANFVTKGQIDIDAIIDRKSKIAKGDIAQGERYYNTVCAGCHAKSGKEPEDMPALGKLANKNPWEIIQKIQNGQPDEKMPAMRAFDLQVSVDILAYLQTLPKE
jgi:thiosulfate dehydrogenase